MHADVERFSFDPAQRFLRVIEQQGRVMLAADTNEQAAILLAYLRDLAVDVIGDFGTPADSTNKKRGPGFLVTADANGVLSVGGGRYWVDGLLCVNDTEKPLPYAEQVDYPGAPQLPSGKVVVYLDAWERHVSSAQDPSLRDVALGGPDTCSRSKLVWQVKGARVTVTGSTNLTATTAVDQFRSTWRDQIDSPSRGRLAVDVKRETGPTDPCPVPAGAGYYGNENQLYRVEVHRGSGVLDDEGQELPVTFKWSRDNGSVVYPLSSIEGTVAVLRDPPVDCTKQLTTGTLVEVVDDLTTLQGRPGVLARVVEVDDDSDDVVVHLATGVNGLVPPERHPLLRRWDHPDVDGGANGVPTRADDGTLVLVEDADPALVLEDGIVVEFEKGGGHRYRTGDYWTFPARAAIGDVVWPRDSNGDAMSVPPHGIDHHLAPLAVVTVDSDGKVTDIVVDCRVGFPRLATLFT